MKRILICWYLIETEHWIQYSVDRLKLIRICFSLVIKCYKDYWECWKSKVVFNQIPVKNEQQWIFLKLKVVFNFFFKHSNIYGLKCSIYAVVVFLHITQLLKQQNPKSFIKNTKKKRLDHSFENIRYKFATSKKNDQMVKIRKNQIFNTCKWLELTAFKHLRFLVCPMTITCKSSKWWLFLYRTLFSFFLQICNRSQFQS